MISVVVAVRNGLPWLGAQLEALSAQEIDEDWELVVADNGSTDGSRDLVAAWAGRFPALRAVDAAARRGPGAARNAGVGAAAGERLLFCDADDVVAPGWLGALAAGLDGAELVVGVFDMGRLNGAPADGAPRPAATAQLGFLPAGLASNLAVRRDVFEAVGGFDEGLLVGEDVDLCWRLQESGARLVVAQEAVVARREPGPLGAVFRQALAYGRSGPLLYRRHRAAGAGRAGAEAARSWAWMVAALPTLGRPDARRRWVRAAGVRLGRLAGSWEQRVFFP